MSTSTSQNSLVCENCGKSLVSLEPSPGCVNCLLKNKLITPALSSAQRHERHTYQHYEVLCRPDGLVWELGRNRTSVTYKARDMNLDMIVALKVLNPALSQQAGARARFLQQAQAMAQIRHPNVANILQFGTLSGPKSRPVRAGEDCFYAMEFVEGETLEDRVGRAGPLPLP